MEKCDVSEENKQKHSRTIKVPKTFIHFETTKEKHVAIVILIFSLNNMENIYNYNQINF